MMPVQLEVIPNQEKKIRKALGKQKGCTINVKRLNNGPHSLLLRGKYAKRYRDAKMGSEVRLPFRHQDLVNNMKHKGGFLPLIAAALAPVIGGVAGGLIEREIAGSGIHDPKLYTLQKRGTGLYLNPYK